MAAPVHAQGLIAPCDPVPRDPNQQQQAPANPAGGGARETCGIKHIFQTLVNIYNFLLGMAAIVAMLFLIWGGIKMLIYQFDEQPEQFLNDAKLTVSRAVTGLVIVIIAYLIVFTLLSLLGLQENRIQEILQGSDFN